MKTFGRLLLIVVVLVAGGGLLFYERPLWVGLQSIHTGLLVAGVQSNYVATPEGRIHYYEAEAQVPEGGIPLVLVHGLADRGESWAPMLKRLKKAGFHVYAPDLLGYGRSPKPTDSDYSIAMEEKTVADFIQALGLQKVDVGGWSMGGWIVMKLAIDHPEMVNRLVVYDSAGIRSDPQPEPRGALFHPTNAAELQKLADLLEPHGKPLPAFVSRDVLREMGKSQWIVDRSMSSMQAGGDALDGQFVKLTMPTLIVWGSDDRLLPPSMGERLHQTVPQSELDLVEGCGHLAPKTCPGRVAAATVDFLKASPASAGRVRTLAAR